MHSFSTFLTLIAVHKIAAQCPKGWNATQGLGCILLEKGGVPEQQALDRCKSLGAHLASPKTADLMTELGELMVASGASYPVWISLNDKEVEGNWIWEDGSPVNFSGFSGDTNRDNYHNNGDVNMNGEGFGADCALTNPAGDWHTQMCGPNFEHKSFSGYATACQKPQNIQFNSEQCKTFRSEPSWKFIAGLEDEIIPNVYNVTECGIECAKRNNCFVVELNENSGDCKIGSVLLGQGNGTVYEQKTQEEEHINLYFLSY